MPQTVGSGRGGAGGAVQADGASQSAHHESSSAARASVAKNDGEYKSSAPNHSRPRQFTATAVGVSLNGGNNSSNIINIGPLIGNASMHDDDPSSDEGGRRGNRSQPTPLFERLVTEEVQELKAYARIIESQQRRLQELERIHGDLEARLEVESRGRQQLESTLEAREREWTRKFDELKSDRDHWQNVVNVEQTKNARLIDQVVRKDQDIHRMLQRKYDHEVGRSVRGLQRQPTERGVDIRGDRSVASASRSPQTSEMLHKSPHEILAASDTAEKVRNRNSLSLLQDFFGL